MKMLCPSRNLLLHLVDISSSSPPSGPRTALVHFAITAFSTCPISCHFTLAVATIYTRASSETKSSGAKPAKRRERDEITTRERTTSTRSGNTGITTDARHANSRNKDTYESLTERTEAEPKSSTNRSSDNRKSGQEIRDDLESPSSRNKDLGSTRLAQGDTMNGRSQKPGSPTSW